jgi:tRNA (cmo5U34)-methyltransferase
MNEFDKKATDWDKDQQHIERAQVIAKLMMKSIPVHKQMKALEFGAGTGLLSFLLKDKFAEITLLDSSPEMMRVAREKIEKGRIMNMRTLCIDLEKEDFRGNFDIIYNQMVLHHIQDINRLFDTFFDLLNPGGFLAVADLFSEDGSFHGADFSGHKGFDVDALADTLKKKGYSNIRYQSCYVMKKTDESGNIGEFPIFLLIASK